MRRIPLVFSEYARRGLARAAIIAMTLSFVGCTQGEGETCKLHEDCADGLMCCKPSFSVTGRGTCEMLCDEVGSDSGAGELDGGRDATTDAPASDVDGEDAGDEDAGDEDAGEEDAGEDTDAGEDAGGLDSGTDAGQDAGEDAEVVDTGTDAGDGSVV